jgi:putative tryptophan/tyrosine transport system substrate-binding protein
MKRRDFITLLGGAATAWPLFAQAQKPVPVIALIGSGAADAAASIFQMRSLDAGMREVGLVQGRDYVLETRWADSDSSRFPALAAELLARRPSAFVVSTILAAKVVQNLSRTVPIVMTGLNDPVAAGLVESLARPGGNVTGVSTMAEDVLLKLVEIMREALPEVRRLSAMMNPTNPSNQAMLDVLRREAAKAGLSIATVSVASPVDLNAAFAELSRQRPGALFVLTDNSLLALADAIIARALAQRVPTFGSFSLPFLQAGALFTYSRDPREAFHGVARLLQKILNGAAPADLPVEQPTKFNLMINLRTARALGLEVPPSLLARADEVIE